MRCAVPELMTHPTPVDGQAAKELRQWNTDRPKTRPHSLIAENPNLIARRVSNFRNLCGIKYGTLEVVGLVAFHEHGESVWSVRCSCGNYETRGNLIIKRTYQYPHFFIDDGCAECMAGARLAARNIALPPWLKRSFRSCCHDESFT